jgi:hypothetical protein
LEIHCKEKTSAPRQSERDIKYQFETVIRARSRVNTERCIHLHDSGDRRYETEEHSKHKYDNRNPECCPFWLVATIKPSLPQNSWLSSVISLLYFGVARWVAVRVNRCSLQSARFLLDRDRQSVFSLSSRWAPSFPRGGDGKEGSTSAVSRTKSRQERDSCRAGSARTFNSFFKTHLTTVPQCHRCRRHAQLIYGETTEGASQTRQSDAPEITCPHDFHSTFVRQALF